jgi:hypothetical protein
MAEKLRQAGAIKSLADAKVSIAFSGELSGFSPEKLAATLGIAEVASSASVNVEKASGGKCPRCWITRELTSEGVCARCAEAEKALAQPA